jgi:hypothetical protein
MDAFIGLMHSPLGRGLSWPIEQSVLLQLRRASQHLWLARRAVL